MCPQKRKRNAAAAQFSELDELRAFCFKSLIQRFFSNICDNDF